MAGKSSKKPAKKTKTVKKRILHNDIPVAVIGVGASAGGLDAISELLRNIPADTQMAFVIIQHLEPKFESKLTEILSRVTSLPVYTVKNQMKIQANRVYIIPPDKFIESRNLKFVLLERVKKDSKYLPIDYFFHSLAVDQREKSIGIILSGTGSDGTMGIKHIKAEGGLTFAQDDSTAKYTGMPHSAIESGNVDIVLPADKIALELIRIGKHPYILKTHLEGKIRDEKSSQELSRHTSLDELFKIVLSDTGVDFSNYKLSTVKRRINRRMVVNNVSKIEDYIIVLKKNTNEVMNLYYDLLINVTTFFRDPESFKLLEKEVFPKLIKRVSRQNSIRIWVPGCSTGEEIYSIAISLIETMNRESVNANLQLFGTDISEPAIDRARIGIYTESALKDLPPEIVRDYFIHVNGSYQISKRIRDVCIFARQDISKDPPFSKMDMISCRNLLIYLSTDLQKKIIPVFHYALNPEGFLLLGPSESVGNNDDLFHAVDKKLKLYRKLEVQNRNDYNFMLPNFQYPRKVEKSLEHFAEDLDILKESDKLILNKFTPAAILINQNLEIIQFRGKIRDFIDPAPGDASLSLFKMLKEGLNLELHSSIKKAGSLKKPVLVENIKIDSNGESKNIDLEVIPLLAKSNTRGTFFLILFNERETGLHKPVKLKAKGTKADIQSTDVRIKKLKEELIITKDHLQSIIEEREASNEELRSALEELQSGNEELQSTNEEMETAREELQSANEELITVNDELENRNLELKDMNNDLNNILASINIPILFLGRDLRIRKYTQKAEAIWNLIPGDIGRPYSNLNPNFFAPDLQKKVLDVMENLESKEFEVKETTGKYYSIKIRPYQTSENKIEGVVILLYDIDSVKKAAFEKGRKDYFEAIQNTVRQPLVVLDKSLKVVSANKSFFDRFGLKEEDTTGKYIFEIGSEQWNLPPLKKLLNGVLHENNSIEDFELEVNYPLNGNKKVKLNASKIVIEDQMEEFILIAMEE